MPRMCYTKSYEKTHPYFSGKELAACRAHHFSCAALKRYNGSLKQGFFIFILKSEAKRS